MRKEELEIEGEKILWSKKKGCRRLILKIASDGRARITSPAQYPRFLVINFLKIHFDWVRVQREKIKNKTNALPPATHRDFLLNKSRARRLVLESIASLNGIYGFNYNKITIRRAKSRWGSCSKQGHLNFNYRVVYLSAELVKYIVAHELCHLKEMNHGKHFWKLVEQTIPNWPASRKQLKNIF